MTVYIQIKQSGRRSSNIAQTALELPLVPHTVGELIACIVRLQVVRHNERPSEQEPLFFLTQEELETQGEGGKVSFGVDYNGRAADADQAIACALQAYADGLFRLFVNEEEAGEADTSLTLHENDVLTFVRLTMLSGRLW